MYMILFDTTTSNNPTHIGRYPDFTPVFTDDKVKVANFLSEYKKVKVYQLDSLTEISSAEIQLLEAKNA